MEILRLNLGCKLFIRDQHLWNEGEGIAEFSSGGSRTIIQNHRLSRDLGSKHWPSTCPAWKGYSQAFMFQPQAVTRCRLHKKACALNKGALCTQAALEDLTQGELSLKVPPVSGEQVFNFKEWVGNEWAVHLHIYHTPS